MHAGLQLFETAHKQYFKQALSEIKNGRKLTHWMWFIFPQIKGLGNSDLSKQYAIKDLEEAEAFIAHPVTGKNLIAIAAALLQLKGANPTHIFGKPDDVKLQSCMTLFALVANTNPVFEQVLYKFFNGKRDVKTIALLQAELLE
ncbi:MAG: DUF1810 domain-containing protein [Rhizobacter sp.]|nr:DUF1810 domain-containing protein [Ferruginibacter sp.]